MEVLIINIGDELLIGQTINTNASWMAEELNKNGFSVQSILTISDKKKDILDSLNLAVSSVDIVLVTGGLGPTKDDITKKTLCEFFNCELIEDGASLNNITRIFKERGYELTPTNREQALLPSCCKPILNKLGTAPGMWFEKDGKIIVSMPGVPFEMKPLMSDYVIPELKRCFKTTEIIHRTILTQGIGESFLSDLIENWELSLPSNIKLAYLPNAGMVLLRLSGYGNDNKKLRQQLEDQIKELQNTAGQYIIGIDEDSIEKVIASLLTSKNKTLATAESCTGGFIAHSITSLPGASNYFRGSVIAYENSVKENLLGVKKETLQKYGAVSEETARKMAEGILKTLNTDYAISTTGIAGPDGGTNEKPVGMVCIAIANKEKTISKTFYFSSDRLRNIQRATYTALGELYRFIKDY